jgi:glyoxylase-like metal-dependent hydrolase (beta-lactamase superfamily II)
MMTQNVAVTCLAVFLALAFTLPVSAQQPQQPPYETRKVAEGVYVFRHVGHQAMFVVGSDGVIATDPINPDAAKIYLQEIRKITQAPIRYVVYSHHHLDHIAGGAPFKEAGATFVAHRRAKTTLERLKNPHAVIPDLVVDDRSVLTVGGLNVELHYVGRNHTDDALVLLVPREKILFAVDWLPVRAILFRNVPESFYDEWMESIDRVLTLDWDKMIPGHPGPGGRLGNKQDVQDQLAFLQDASAAVKAEAQAGKCWDGVEKELKLPKYESWPGYEQNLPFVLRRYCALWGRGT